jgi:hypothetical protein
VDPVPDPLLLRKFGSAGNPTRDLWICSQELRSQDHSGGRETQCLEPNIHNAEISIQDVLHSYFVIYLTTHRLSSVKWKDG